MKVKHLFYFFLPIVLSCSSTSQSLSLSKGAIPKELSKVFLASYKYTWKAALKETERFPLKISNQNAGVIVTEDITTFDDAYETFADRQSQDVRKELTYRIEIRLKPLPKTGKYPRTEVRVTKFIKRHDDFGKSTDLKSNMYDERVILYRIKRLLRIERLKIEKNRN
jgi:hypothetical protein